MGVNLDENLCSVGNLSCRRSLFSWEEDASTELLEGISPTRMVTDSRIWMAFSIGGYIVNSGYAVIQRATQDISVNCEFSSAILAGSKLQNFCSIN
ncbi:hypothetical protein L195_g054987 [Trifolium pratense]|uniref:Uncharacterized protein n=1 Tax=Trifolium pratense TaxID=57577 RepID=A0A2K3KIY3_TRIPR|nr:hypothetical protein L195_g054987 [Trifolium pratense]